MGKLGVEDLERDGLLVAEVVREVDAACPTSPELALDSVAVGHAALEPLAQVRQPGHLMDVGDALQ